jgi:hypothetical protein
MDWSASTGDKGNTESEAAALKNFKNFSSVFKHHEALRRAEQQLPRMGYGAGALRDPMLTYRREKSEVH